MRADLQPSRPDARQESGPHGVPFFLKFCSDFPPSAKLCPNGHGYLKRQRQKEGIAYQARDHGSADPQRLQALGDDLSGRRSNTCWRKGRGRWPHPFTPSDPAAGYRDDLSIRQGKILSAWDRPAQGRVFFEAVIRENLGLGRPDQVPRTFGRRVTRAPPGRFRTRVIPQGVSPSLAVDYPTSPLQQDPQEARALRTATTIHNPHEFAGGQRLGNRPRLRPIGFQANRRWIEVEGLSHDGPLGEETSIVPAR